MTQPEALLFLLRSGPKTTNEIINSPFHLAAEYRRTASDLRREGYVIEYTHGKGGSGVYTLVSDPPRVTATGQQVFAGMGA